MKDTKLTEKQRQFAAEHHDVVEKYLRARRLSVDEFYGVVIERFLKAVKQYDEREDLQQYEFSTIANNAMRSAISNHFAKEKRRNDKVKILSLDYRYGDSNLTFGDKLADETVDVCETVCEKLSQPTTRLRLLHKKVYHRAMMCDDVREAA